MVFVSKTRFYLSLVLLTTVCEVSLAIDIDQVKELECIKPRPTVARNVDYSWMMSVSRWYMPLQSKLNLYRLSESLLQKKVPEITESEIQLNSTCITFKLDDPFPNPKIFGFIDKTVTFATTQVIENSFGFKGTWENDQRGRVFITLKDNESFVFFTTCWEDNQASWFVISTEKILEDSTKDSILEHANSLGFKTKDEFIVQQDYNSCPPIPTPPPQKNEL